ncbi:Pet127-domain-containing protein, partial [Hortaea werneckii]
MQFLKVFSWVALTLGACITAIALPQGMHAMTAADAGSPTPSDSIGEALTPSHKTAHEVSSSSTIAMVHRNKAPIIPTPVPNIPSTAARSTDQPPAKTINKAYSTSCFTVTFPTSTATFASRSPIDVRYTRREVLPHSANAVEREPQTASILAWCIGGTEEGEILSEGRNAETELAKPTSRCVEPIMPVIARGPRLHLDVGPLFCCRHHRGLVASRAPRKSIDAREADAIDDDLLDNPLNDINEEYGSHTRPAKVRKANEDAEKSQTTKDRIREGQAQDGTTTFQALKSSLGQRVQSPQDVASLGGDGVEQADQRGAKFDKIVAELRNEVPGSDEDAMASKNLEAVDGQDIGAGDSSATSTVSDVLPEESPLKPIERPVFSHTPGTDEIYVPPGQVSSQLKPTRRVDKASDQRPSDSREDEPEDTMLGAQRPLSIGREPRPKSLWQKVQETKLRPQWGGGSAGNSAFTSIDFESLRAADKRSPEPLVNTAGATRAWGGELNAKIAAETETDPGAQRSHLEQRKDANSRISKFLASGFEELKKNLASRVEEPAEQLREERPEQHENVSEVQDETHARAVHEPSDEGPEDEGRESQPTSRSQETKSDRLRARKKARREAQKEARKARQLQAAQKSQTQNPNNKPSQEANEKPAQEPSNTPDDSTAVGEVTEQHQESEPLQSTLPPAAPTKIESTDINSLNASELVVNALNIEQPPVLPLQYGLDRALFNQGVYQLQDAHSRVYNFDPYLQKVMPITEFDFNALSEYKTSSQDEALSSLAKQHGSKFIGSTSSMTGTLAHFHFLISNWRELNLNMLSRGFGAETARFTNINRAPNAIFLRHKNGTYAIDADKEHDNPNVLMMLGKSMEKLLTLPKEQYERYRKGSENPILDAEKDVAESYEYTTMGNFLMRSQLDAYDSRLPGQ